MRHKVARLREQLQAAERSCRAKLHQSEVERRAPIMYKSLELNESRLRYVNLSGQAFVVAFDDIEKVEFVREEAVFPDIWGPYSEEKWRIQTSDRNTLELMEEEVHRRKLVEAFVRHLPGFQEAAAATGLTSTEDGTWECFRRRDGYVGAAV